MIIDAITAIVGGIIAGRMGLTNLVIYLGAAAIGAVVAGELAYHGVLWFEQARHAIYRWKEPISPEDQRIVDAVRKELGR